MFPGSDNLVDSYCLVDTLRLSSTKFTLLNLTFAHPPVAFEASWVGWFISLSGECTINVNQAPFNFESGIDIINTSVGETAWKQKIAKQIAKIVTHCLAKPEMYSTISKNRTAKTLMSETFRKVLNNFNFWKKYSQNWTQTCNFEFECLETFEKIPIKLKMCSRHPTDLGGGGGNFWRGKMLEGGNNSLESPTHIDYPSPPVEQSSIDPGLRAGLPGRISEIVTKSHQMWLPGNPGCKHWNRQRSS